MLVGVTVEGKMGKSPEVGVAVGIWEEVWREDVDVVSDTLRSQGRRIYLGRSYAPVLLIEASQEGVDIGGKVLLDTTVVSRGILGVGEVDSSSLDEGSEGG